MDSLNHAYKKSNLNFDLSTQLFLPEDLADNRNARYWKDFLDNTIPHVTALHGYDDAFFDDYTGLTLPILPADRYYPELSTNRETVSTAKVPENRFGYSRLPRGVAVALSGLALSMLLTACGGSQSQPMQTITSPTDYTVQKQEDVRKIAAKFGLPPAVIMMDNNLSSFTVGQRTKLLINPAGDFRKIPKSLGQQAYSDVIKKVAYQDRKNLVYEDALVANVYRTSGVDTPETILLLSDIHDTSDLEGCYAYSGGTKVRISRLCQNAYIVDVIAVLDSQDRIISESTIDKITFNYKGGGWKGTLLHTDTPLEQQSGRHAELIPLGDSNGGYTFLVRSKMSKQDFLRLNKDLEKVRAFNSSGQNLLNLMGRNIRIEDSDGDGNQEVVILSWARDVDWYGREKEKPNLPFELKRYEFEPGSGMVDYTTQDFIDGELIRLFSEFLLDGHLTNEEKEELYVITSSLGGRVNNAISILRTAEKRKIELMGAIAESSLSGADPIPKIASILDINDPYILRQVIGSNLSSYTFSVNEKGQAEPLTIELYNERGTLYGVVPKNIQVVGIFDPEDRRLATQGRFSLGRESALEIRLDATKTIGESEPVVTNFSIVPREEVAEKTHDALEKARRGEIPVSEAMQLAGEFIDVISPINAVAGAIQRSSDIVDTLRSHGISNVGDIGRLMSGEVKEVQQIPGLTDLMKNLFK